MVFSIASEFVENIRKKVKGYQKIEIKKLQMKKTKKTENEGFNIQKNGTFDIGHLYSKNTTAIKVHYILIQIAHLLRQLLEKGSASIRDDILFKRKTISEVSELLKRTLTTQISNLEQIKHMQLRFVNQDYMDYIKEQKKINRKLKILY